MSIEAMKKAAAPSVNPASAQFEAMHARGIVWISTIAAAKLMQKAEPTDATLLAEKDALLRQALEALENLQSKTHDGMNGEFRICCATRPDEPHAHCEAGAASEAIRTHLGVKP